MKKYYFEDFEYIRDTIKQLGISHYANDNKYFVCNDRSNFKEKMVMLFNFQIWEQDAKLIESSLDIKLNKDTLIHHYVIVFEDSEILNDFYTTYKEEIPTGGRWYYFTDHMIELEL